LPYVLPAATQGSEKCDGIFPLWLELTNFFLSRPTFLFSYGLRLMLTYYLWLNSWKARFIFHRAAMSPSYLAKSFTRHDKLEESVGFHFPRILTHIHSAVRNFWELPVSICIRKWHTKCYLYSLWNIIICFPARLIYSTHAMCTHTNNNNYEILMTHILNGRRRKRCIFALRGCNVSLSQRTMPRRILTNLTNRILTNYICVYEMLVFVF